MEPSPDYFEVVAGRGFFRPLGCVSLDEAVELVDGAIAHARASGVTRLMMNVSLLTGFESPTLSQRYFFVDKWARTAKSAVRAALVVRPEMVDPEKFGVTVAVNRRWEADVFVAEAPAIAWLDSGEPPSLPSMG